MKLYGANLLCGLLSLYYLAVNLAVAAGFGWQVWLNMLATCSLLGLANPALMLGWRWGIYASVVCQTVLFCYYGWVLVLSLRAQDLVAALVVCVVLAAVALAATLGVRANRHPHTVQIRSGWVLRALLAGVPLAWYAYTIYGFLLQPLLQSVQP